ncbi:hypothetical protein [Moraxella oblonga]|uniref:hypothetical protein n=1 Tax=Moraxella oblonga TaxID=200413 RepID=UPI00082FAE87|nr:hypothetical protein [Moraxella oblonga]
MFKNIRILILLCILLIVAVNAFDDKNHNWQKATYVYLFPINMDNDDKVQTYINTLNEKEFAQINDYIKEQAKRYHQSVTIYYRFGEQVKEIPPAVPRNGGIMDAIIWSLKFRYYHFKHKPDTPFKPDLTLYLQYHSPNKHILTETSTALQNGRIGVVNLFGTDKKTANNNVVIAHESLHGFGATDKYDLKTGIPLYPQGYANPSQNPVLPQKQAELMAVHIPISQDKFEMARELKQTVVGELTAKEIGWIKK